MKRLQLFKLNVLLTVRWRLGSAVYVSPPNVFQPQLDSICSILIYSLAFLVKHRKMSIYEKCSLGNRWNFSEKLTVTLPLNRECFLIYVREEIYQVSQGGVC